jgi:arylamine N-acetyltransferase
VHLVLICTLQSGAKYVLDVAFGGDGPTKPLPLTENTPTLNLGTQEVRYVYESIAQNAPRPLTQPQKYWTYQYRNGPDKPWNSHYIFTETEYLVNDFNVFNHFTSSGQTFQRTTILVVKFLRSEAEKAPLIVGKLMLVNGTLKRNITGRTEMIKKCKNEAERIEVLKEWFGITLTEEEERGIGGLITELRDAGASIVAA